MNKQVEIKKLKLFLLLNVIKYRRKDNNMVINLNSNDVQLSLLDYGATIYQLKTKDKDGNFNNIVLTHKNIETYYNGNPAYLGATCGRYAGRIANGQFKINEETYNLTKNFNDKHTLHGGNKNLSKVVWEYEVSEVENKSICTFKYLSKHLEEGFPANVYFEVKYILEGNELTIEYFARADRKTYLNLTNHSYFNLSDESTVDNHFLQLDSNSFIDCDVEQIPIGIETAKNNEFDFTKPKKFGNLSNKKHKTLKQLNGFDNVFILNKNNKQYDVKLKSEKSGRSVEIKTSYPCCVVYTYNKNRNSELLNKEDLAHCAVAIELQYAPNAMNSDLLEIPIIDENNSYENFIKYKFN